MKTINRLLALLLCLLTALMMISCAEDERGDPLNTVDEPSEAVPAAEPTGYFGTMNGYVYRYKDGRNRNWEEDILDFAEVLLSSHPKFTERTWVYGAVSGDTDEFYDPVLRNSVISQIDILIGQISDLQDSEILYELKRIAALLEDRNTDVFILQTMYFPLSFTAIKEDGETSVYVISAPKEHPEIIFGKLEAINGMPIDRVMSRLGEYVCADNPYWKTYSTVTSRIISAQMLEAAGIIDPEPYTAEFTVMTDSGSLTVELAAVPTEERNDDTMESKSLRAAGSLSRKNSDLDYWYENIPEDGMVFVRMNYCYPREDLSYSDFWNQIMKSVNSYETAPKLVFDLRGNSNGYEPKGFDGFVASLSRTKVSGVYVLIDSGTCYAAVDLAVKLKQEIAGTVVLGEPAGKSPNFLSTNSYTMFEHYENAYFTVSEYYYVVVEDYGSLTYMPDEIIYQTFDDYRQGIDTVMEAVKNAE